VANRLVLAFALMAALVLGAGSARAQQPAHQPEDAQEAVHEEMPAESIWPFIGKIFNFAVLAGVIVYFARTPLSNYLTRRRSEVRADLETAQAMKADAAAKIAEIEARMKTLPAEIDALRARGRDDIAAEGQRLRELAAAEKQRLLDAATREIDQRVRAARRELVEHAADLTVAIARTKIQSEITDADRTRLVDRYLSQVTSHE
jgi:F-type H+-transporting ATPase subunit b